MGSIPPNRRICLISRHKGRHVSCVKHAPRRKLARGPPAPSRSRLFKGMRLLKVRRGGSVCASILKPKLTAGPPVNAAESTRGPTAPASTKY